MVSASEFLSEVEGMGLDREAVSSALLELYVAGGEVPYERGSEKPVMLPYWDHEDWVIRFLWESKLVTSGAKMGNFDRLTRYHSLTEKGRKVAQEIFRDFLSLKKEAIVAASRGFSRKLLYLIVAGCSGGVGLTYRVPERREVSAEDLSQLLQKIESDIVLIEDHAIVDLVDRFGFKGALEQIKDRELAVSRKRHPIVFARFMVQYPLVAQSVVELFETLVNHRVAMKLPAYDSRGYLIGEEYSAPPEVGDEMISLSDVDVSAELGRFAAISIFLRRFSRDFTKGRLESFARAFNISESEIEVALDAMAKEGLTSKYNRLGKNDSPPFMIMDRERYSERVHLDLKMLANDILGE